MLDLLIKGGTVVDGTGRPGYVADVGIRGGRIERVDPSIDEPAAEVFDATGLVVTPGFIDIHTHYDGQVTWDSALLPSSAHGVTTIVAGACGIGFAPVRPGWEDWLVRITEGVEDIPGTALHVGIPWGWESFVDYLDHLDGRQFSVDVAFHVPHSAVRAYVLGERAVDDAPATDEEVDRIAHLVAEGIRAGAVGFGTSRMSVHRSSDGSVVPGTRAPEEELRAIANAVRDAGGGVIQILPSGSAGGVEGQPGEAMRVGLTQRDQHALSAEIEMMRRLHHESGQPITFSFAENRALGGDEFTRAREIIRDCAAAGERVHPQYAPRSVGGLVTLDTYHPFTARPSYREIATLPVRERARRMADPDVKARILSEEDVPLASDDPRKHTHQTLQKHVGDIYRLDGADYEPDPARSMLALATASGRDPLDVLYDHLVADDGAAVLIWLATGYQHGNLDTVREFVTDAHYVMGLGDGGAHVQFICDASFTTFLLTHWGRDRWRGPTVPLETLVRRLTLDHAELYGLDDRGLLRARASSRRQRDRFRRPWRSTCPT